MTWKPNELGRRALSEMLIPLIFLVISATAIYLADMERYEVAAASRDILDRIFRNMFLVMSLIIPIVAGLGLNFGIVLGAMAGQVGLVMVQNGEIPGLPGIIVAVICSIPIATLLGYLTGLLFNRTRGREMIAGIILGFFASGIYQFLFLILAGPVIPISSKALLLPDGKGLRVTVNLTTVERRIDEFFGTIHLRWERFDERLNQTIVEHWGSIPVFTVVLLIFCCLGLTWFLRTKLGQDLRAVGQDAHVAEVAGIKVNRCRIIAIILSMILAGIGQIIFLQNMAMMNTFTSHEQVGFYSVAAILVGGATVSRAHIWNAVVGTILFHTMLVSVTSAGQNIMASPQIGEFLREFVAFAIIGTTLAIYAWKGQRPAGDPEEDREETLTGPDVGGG